MFIYPNINPVAFHLGIFKVHWYGLMYLLSFLAGWQLIKYKVKKLSLPFSTDQITDLIFYIALGVILGGRLGYVLFYDLPYFLNQPIDIIKIWEGGMSFHGGFLGVLLAIWLYSKKNKQHFFDVTDLVAPIAPIGLAMGRIGNFIQGELWGKITNIPWAMIYPHVDQIPRHPSEIYEFLLEGILLFTVLWTYSLKHRPRSAVSGMFLLGYVIIRCFCEFFRQPDIQLGYLAFDWLTIGQLLSFPMIVAGIIILYFVYFKNKK